MSFDILKEIAKRRGENYRLHKEYLNAQLVRVLNTIGYDRFYERGEGAYLIDRHGDRYLDFLSGFGVFALGRSHPVVKKALSDILEADLPALVQLDCALLPGMLGEALLAKAPPSIKRCFLPIAELKRSKRQLSLFVMQRGDRAFFTAIIAITVYPTVLYRLVALKSFVKGLNHFYPIVKRFLLEISTR